MKSLKNILLLCAAIAILISQLLYVVLVNTDLNNQIAGKEEEAESIQRQIAVMEGKLRLLPQTKKELAATSKQKEALLRSVPSNMSSMREFLELVKMLEIHTFARELIEKSDNVLHQDDIGTIIEKKYKFTFISTFTESKKIIENINSSYQVININEYSIDNQVQVGEYKELLSLWYGEQINEVVKTTLSISIFVRPNDPSADEIYDALFDLTHDPKNAFLYLDNENSSPNPNLSAPLPETPEPEEITQPQTTSESHGRFRLDISDAMTSGDTYKFLGPGSDPNSYTGLLSTSNTHITVTIKDDGYDVVIEDENGKVKQNSVRMNISNPTFTIYSEMRKVQDTMPLVHIYIRNYTKHQINVTLNGSMLDNIHIYNEFDEEVQKGQTKGKVKLT